MDLSRQPSSIHQQTRTRNPLGHPTHQKQNSVRDIVRSANTAQRTIRGLAQELRTIFAELLTLALQQGGIDISRANAIHADVMFAMIDCHGASEVHYPRL